MKRSSHRVLTEVTARAERLRPVLDELATLPASQAAVALNKSKVPSTGGGHWFAGQVISLRKRLVASPQRYPCPV
jgi:hypothetical protein